MKEFDAFISYESTSGQQIAMRLCDYLERGGLKCWIAPRNIQYGQVYAGMISNAIKCSEFIVCVYTENYNSSKNVKREVELANAHKISILPLVTCDVPFDADLEYYFAAHQQIRVTKNNLEKGFEDVLRTIQSVVKREPTLAVEVHKVVQKPETKIVPVELPKPIIKKKVLPKIVLAIAGVVVVAAIAVAVFLMTREKTTEDVLEVVEVAEPIMKFEVNGTEFAMIMINDTMYGGETEVTQGLWKAVMGTTIDEQRDKADPSWAIRGIGDNCPMYYVNLEECCEFASKLSMMTGKRFELPTEREWEMCISGEESASTEDIAWHSDNSNESVHPVKGKKANNLGIYDMAGNVCEWCNTQVLGNLYVCRGGDWCMPKQNCVVGMKDKCNANMRRSSLGFRIIMKIDK